MHMVTMLSPPLPKSFRYITLILLIFLSSCSSGDPISKKKTETLTSDERYLVDLYMKITKIEGTLQDNQEKVEKKLLELKSQTDSARVIKTLENLERNPERWLAVYNRINILIRRSERRNHKNSS
jgi:thiamine biosynthesis lipoprotein ApbE